MNSNNKFSFIYHQDFIEALNGSGMNDSEVKVGSTERSFSHRSQSQLVIEQFSIEYPK